LAGNSPAVTYRNKQTRPIEYRTGHYRRKIRTLLQ